MQEWVSWLEIWQDSFITFHCVYFEVAQLSCVHKKYLLEWKPDISSLGYDGSLFQLLHPPPSSCYTLWHGDGVVLCVLYCSFRQTSRDGWRGAHSAAAILAQHSLPVSLVFDHFVTIHF